MHRTSTPKKKFPEKIYLQIRSIILSEAKSKDPEGLNSPKVLEPLNRE
jgi:hypothetical protein